MDQIASKRSEAYRTLQATEKGRQKLKEIHEKRCKEVEAAVAAENPDDLRSRRLKASEKIIREEVWLYDIYL